MRGDMLELGLWIMLLTDTDPGECVTIGPGLLMGELCCVMGDAEGDSSGD